jgi:hypothetical protein
MTNLLRSLLPILLAGAHAAFAADSIAFITNLKGEVAVDGNPRPALLSELAKGQKISVGRESTASVMYIQSGKEYVLRGPSDFTVRDTEISGSTAMPPVIRDTSWRPPAQVVAQASQTSAASVRMRSIAPAKKDHGPAAVYPTQGSVATLQPTFRWHADDARAQGEFVLLVDGQEKPVLVAKAAGGAYRAPAKLMPEKDYSWSVTVAGNEVGGRFRTLSGEALATIETRRPSDRAEFSDRILFALLLREMGAVQDARELLAKLALERPDLSELAAFAK